MTNSTIIERQPATRRRWWKSIAEGPPLPQQGLAWDLGKRDVLCVGTVLIVEDDPHLSSALRQRIEKAGLQVHAAFDGPSALMTYHAIEPDVVVLDLCLPGMDGARFLHFVRTTPGLRQAPVIAMTGAPDESLKAKVRSWGVSEFLEKPVSTRALAHSVLRALRYE